MRDELLEHFRRIVLHWLVLARSAFDLHVTNRLGRVMLRLVFDSIFQWSFFLFHGHGEIARRGHRMVKDRVLHEDGRLLASVGRLVDSGISRSQGASILP